MVVDKHYGYACDLTFIPGLYRSIPTCVHADNTLFITRLAYEDNFSFFSLHRFEPPLPSEKLQAIKRLGFGVLNKLVMLFPFAFWDESCDTFGHVNSSGEGWRGPSALSIPCFSYDRLSVHHSCTGNNPHQTMRPCTPPSIPSPSRSLRKGSILPVLLILWVIWPWGSAGSACGRCEDCTSNHPVDGRPSRHCDANSSCTS